MTRGLPCWKGSITDYCGPCHTQARWACVVLVMSQVVGFLLGKYWTTMAIWKIIVLLQFFNVLGLYLEWECLKYILLPWQYTLWKNGSTNFRLPIFTSFLKTGFYEWKFGISMVSLLVNLSLQSQVVQMGRDFQYEHGMDFRHQCIVGSCFLATSVSLFWVVMWSQPCCKGVRWDFDPNRQSDAVDETHYKTVPYDLGLTYGKTNHYESLIRYAQYSGMFGVQQMINSLQEAETSLLWYAVKDFEEKCITRIQLVMRFNFAMVFCRVLLRTVPQVCLSTWRYHNNWEQYRDNWERWQSLWPLGVNIAVFVLSDASTFLTAESIYGEFTSKFLADWDEDDYSRQKKTLMASSRRFHHARLAIMASSAVLISSCSCLVIADWICQPLGFDGSCNLHEQRTVAILLVGCLMTFSMANVAVAIKLLLEPLPLWEPAPRKNNMKLYVDEDAVRYYRHVPSTIHVRMIRDMDTNYQHMGASETYGVNLKVEKGDVFKDEKLLRVQEPGQQCDMKRLTRQRKDWLLKHATKDDWFELALRFGKELTPYA